LGLRPLERGRLPQGWNLRLLWKCLALSVLRLISVPSMTDPQLSTLNPKTINHQETTPRAESPLATEPKRPNLWVDPFSDFCILHSTFWILHSPCVPESRSPVDVGCWMLDVGCWMLSPSVLASRSPLSVVRPPSTVHRPLRSQPSTLNSQPSTTEKPPLGRRARSQRSLNDPIYGLTHFREPQGSLGVA
jgi:hypothetical protein